MVSLCDVFLLKCDIVTYEVFVGFNCEPGFQSSLRCPQFLVYGFIEAFSFDISFTFGEISLDALIMLMNKRMEIKFVSSISS